MQIKGTLGMLSRRSGKAVPAFRKLKFESLEDRRVLSTTALEAPVTSTEEAGSIKVPKDVLPTEIPTLTYNRFHELGVAQVPLLTPAQVATIPDIGWFDTMSAAQRAALTLPQVQALRIGPIRLTHLTPTQIGWLTTSQIQSVIYYDFKYLLPSQIPLLTSAQIGSVPTDYTFRIEMSAAQRAALTQPQIQSLPISGETFRIDWLSSQQINWLTVAQIRSVIQFDFDLLTPSQVPSLTPAQIATVVDDWTLRTSMPVQSRAALTEPQIQALNVDKTRIDWLTPTQLTWLTAAQAPRILLADLAIQLPATLIPYLSHLQIAAVPDNFIFSSWTSAARAALTAQQVQVLNIPAVRIDFLTPQQVGFLTSGQIASLPINDLKYLNPNQIPLVTTSQIAAIPDPGPFSEWSDAARAALTVTQVQALNVAQVRINLLTSQQISWLTIGQIQSLARNDIALLAPEQIQHVSPMQFAQMPDLYLFAGWSDELKASLSHDQLMALPFDVLSTFMKVELSQMPPADYHPAVNKPIGPDGLPVNDHSIAPDVFNLVPLTGATHVAIASGDWTNPAIWQNGQVPSAGAKVVISSGATVRFNAVMSPSQAIKWLRIDGTLTFATNLNTDLRVDTIVVYTNGRLHIGTATAPIADNITARVIIPDGGPVDTVWDPHRLSRGLLSRGEVRMFGRTVTPYATLQADPLAGQTSLTLAQVPIGWRIGDELVIAGVDPINANFGSERVHITGISGSSISLDRPLTYSHDAPDGYGFTVQVANLNRNIQFIAEDPSVNLERPHIAFFDNPNVDVENVLIQGFGRTDKTKAINSSVVVGGVLQPGTGTNPRARYALHFHHTGVNPAFAPAIVRGNVVVGSPGWGYVNHQSNVVMENNVALDVVGAGFTTEDGNEIGAFRRNLAMNAAGSGAFILSRRSNHDFGHGGHGFWFQGPGVEVNDNIVAGTRGGAYAYLTSSSMAMFDTANIPAYSSSGTVHHDAVPVGSVPFKPFTGNTAYAVEQGLEIWFHLTNLNEGESLVDDFTAWNVRLFGMQLAYSGHVNVRNATLIGRLNAVSGYGIQSNRLTHDIAFDNLRIEGFDFGIIVPPRRSTVINGGRFANVQNIIIPKGHDTIRSVHVTSPITFVPLTPAQLAGRQIYDVTLSATMAPSDNLDREVESLFSADDIQIAIGGGQMLQLYFAEQGANVVPFPTAPVPTIEGFPSAYVGKTNQQLSQTYGLWFNGGNLPAGAYTPPKYRGLAIIENLGSGADFDADGIIDGTDFLAWQRGLGMQLALKFNGDADGDSDVDAADLAEWRAAAGSAATDAVVEAASSSPESSTDQSTVAHNVMELQSLASAALALVEKQKPERGNVAVKEKSQEAAEQTPVDPRIAALLSVTEENAHGRAWRPPVREGFDEPDRHVFSGVFEQFDSTLGL
jgi:hypothetical protein